MLRRPHPARRWSALEAPTAGRRCAPPPRPSAAALPEVLIFGAGHVGRALAAALALLPVRAGARRPARRGAAPARRPGVETRADAAARGGGAPARRRARAFVVLTHDHALDFLIAREALARGDAAYVGMIGSRTKRVSFQRWLRATAGPAPTPAPLVCPIGAAGRPDKRPEVIAAFVAAEIMQNVASRAGANARATQQDT